jgi:tetratricopeptide (TPR) repeat protein
LCLTSTRLIKAAYQLDRSHRGRYFPSVLPAHRWLAAVALAFSLFATGCLDKPTEHRVRANAYLRGGDAQKALSEVEAGLAKRPNDVALLILKGKALFELDRLDDAHGAFTAAIFNGKNLEATALNEARLGLAIIAMRKKDWKKARAQFQSLVESDKSNATARINLARVCLQMKQIDCALEHGVEAGHLQGDSEEVLFTLGRIYVVAKKLDDAEKTFQHICDVVPGASSCPYGIALVAAQKGDKERALAKLKEALERKMPNPAALADDPLLSPLAEEPAFKELAAKAKGG